MDKSRNTSDTDVNEETKVRFYTDDLGLVDCGGDWKSDERAGL